MTKTVNKAILITGCAGFIGSNLAKWILANTEDVVIGVDDMSGGFEENLPQEHTDRFIFIFCSVTGPAFLDSLYQSYKPSITYHLAAYAAEGRSNHIRVFNHQNNTIGTANVINCCVNHGSKLIFTSSVAVYSGGKPPYNEEDTPAPVDEYGVSKYCSELSIKIAGQHQGLEWVILRPRNVYGPGQNIYDPARNVFGIWMYQILNKQPMTVFGEGLSVRDFTFIDDILGPMYNSINTPSGTIINIGSSRGYRILEANKIMMSVTGYRKLELLESRPEVANARCYTGRSEMLIGYKDITSLEQGLTKMWEWVQQQPKRERQIPPPLETTKNAHASLV